MVDLCTVSGRRGRSTRLRAFWTPLGRTTLRLLRRALKACNKWEVSLISQSLCLRSQRYETWSLHQDSVWHDIGNCQAWSPGFWASTNNGSRRRSQGCSWFMGPIRGSSQATATEGACRKHHCQNTEGAWESQGVTANPAAKHCWCWEYVKLVPERVTNAKNMNRDRTVKSPIDSLEKAHSKFLSLWSLFIRPPCAILNSRYRQRLAIHKITSALRDILWSSLPKLLTSF